MTNREKLKIAHAMLGSACFHNGEHGEIVGVSTDYAEPMVIVMFGKRRAILKPSEVGSK